MGEYIYRGSKYVYRDKDDVLVIKRRGDKIELNPEQEQRHNAGKPGSVFQREEDQQAEPETVEVSVANEAVKPAEDGFQAAASGTRNKRIPAPAPSPTRERGAAGDTKARGPVASPVTSTETKRDSK